MEGTKVKSKRSMESKDWRLLIRFTVVKGGIMLTCM